MSQPRVPRNPFYFLLLAFSLLFAVTAVAYAVIPILEEKARQAGEPPPPSPFRQALNKDGWKWLLYEAAIIIVLGFLAMAQDRFPLTPPSPSGGEGQSDGDLQKERTSPTIPRANEPPETTPSKPI